MAPTLIPNGKNPICSVEMVQSLEGYWLYIGSSLLIRLVGEAAGVSWRRVVGVRAWSAVQVDSLWIRADNKWL